MTMQKWNYEKRAYEPYTVPSSWHTPIYSFDMGEIVNCPSCYDKEIREERAHAKDSD